MGRFQGFYTGGDVAQENTSYSETEVFAKRRQKQENGRVSTRQMKIWQCDLDKCVTLSDYQNYVKKYNSSDNPCIYEATQKIDDLTFANCKSVAEYNNYLSLFPSGKNVIQAYVAIRKLQANTSSNTTIQSPYIRNKTDTKPKKNDDPYLALRILGTILIFIFFGYLATFINSFPSWLRGVCILSGVGLGKWIWNKD